VVRVPLDSRVEGRDTGNPDHGRPWIASDGELAREEVGQVRGGRRHFERRAAPRVWSGAGQVAVSVPRCRQAMSAPSSAANRRGRPGVIRDQSKERRSRGRLFATAWGGDQRAVARPPGGPMRSFVSALLGHDARAGAGGSLLADMLDASRAGSPVRRAVTTVHSRSKWRQAFPQRGVTLSWSRSVRDYCEWR